MSTREQVAARIYAWLNDQTRPRHDPHWNHDTLTAATRQLLALTHPQERR